MTNLKKILEHFNKFEYRKTPDELKKEFKEFIDNNESQEIINNTNIFLEKDYDITSSYGAGIVTYTPWVAIKDKDIKDKKIDKMVEEGVHINYILSWHDKKLFLTLMQSIEDRNETDIKESTKKIRSFLEKTNDWIYDKVEFDLGLDDKNNGIQKTVSGRPKKYRLATICYKEYDLEDIDNISEEHLVNDLKEIKEIYNQYKKYYLNENNIQYSKDLVELNAYKQVIFYGAPGTGKSYKVNEMANLLSNDKEDNIIRVTIHPDYDYSDFVVSIKPVKENDDITYDVVGGPFAQALKKAFDCPDENIILIIEDMTRGNIAAVFGDVFQLLDRNVKGDSEYPIKNEMLSSYVYGKKSEKSVYIPYNLSIIGTVNTSDQNVYVMDTAFKRRFDFEYVSFKENALDNDFEFKITKDKLIKWNDFRGGLNDYILENHQLNEDKCLGTFFVKIDENSKSDIEHNTRIIKNKVLNYIFEDIDSGIYNSDSKVLKYNNFSSIFDKFGKENIFSDNFSKKLS